jgi:uncharacterized protein
MRPTIIAQLKNLEEERGIRILYACESGSRAWGFHSPDSDYDVRFIYAHPKEWYLGIEERKDFIEFPKDPVLDITGYDIRKMLRLFRASNAKIFEWIQSPVVYAQDDAFLEGLRTLVPRYFSPKAGLHHYLGLAKNTVEQHLQADPVKLKKYFYALRPVLAARWIAERDVCPPMEFHLLREMVEDAAVQERIDRLLAQKAVAGEGEMIGRDKVLDDFIQAERSRCGAHAEGLERKESEAAPLNHLFQKTIGII